MSIVEISISKISIVKIFINIHCKIIDMVKISRVKRYPW